MSSATTPTECGCCSSGTPVPCGVTCEKKTGPAAFLCGYEEFADPSTPPKKYRHLTQTNSQTVNQYEDATNCGHFIGTQTCSISGDARYDKDTCAFSQSGTNNCGPLILGPFGDSCGIKATNTKTRSTQAMDGSPCCNLYIYTSVGGAVNLDEEDTEEDAENRAAALVPDWTPCADCSLCTAFRVKRTSGFSFAWQKAHAKVTWDAIIGRHYGIRLIFERRAYGSSDPWVQIGSFNATVVADNIHEETDWTDIPEDDGTETRAGGCLVFLKG